MIGVKSEGQRGYKKTFQKNQNYINSSMEENRNKHQLPLGNNNEMDCEKIKIKNLGINRYFSQKTFKNHKNVQGRNLQAKINSKISDQYFPAEELYFTKLVKPTLWNQKTEKFIQGSMTDKKKIETMSLKINNLKETTSTQSAQNRVFQREIPEFLRIKSGRYSNAFQYLSKRSFTSKSSLRRQNFKIISKLGEGKFGKVFLVKQIFTGFVLAMKIVEKKRIIQNGLLEQFIRELRIQGYLQHPNIISLYGFFSDQTHFYSLMELGCNGRLYSIIESKKKISQESTSFITKNLLQAVDYIHSHKVLHRDMKPENIVLILGNVKICDFGWAANKAFSGDLRNTFCGTPIYLSPQIIQGSLYNQKVDLWAIGIIAFELLLGTIPFNIKNSNQLYRIVTDEIKFPEMGSYSAQFEEFIRAILSKSPGKRYSATKLLQMDFITKYSALETCQQLCK